MNNNSNYINPARETALWRNSNVCVIGTSGSGKTTTEIKPFIESTDGSFIVADTKSNLYETYRDSLVARGYTVHLIDFTDPLKGEGYNPLDYIATFKDKQGNILYDEKDLLSLANTLMPKFGSDDPFWEQSASDYLAILLAYVCENFYGKEKNLVNVTALFNYMISGITNGQIDFLEEYCLLRPYSLASKKYLTIRGTFAAEKMTSSIEMFVSRALSVYDLESTKEMLSKPSSFNIEDIGRKKTAVFLNISDNDSVLYPLVNTFYTQCFQKLLAAADKEPNSRLRVPTRILLDDFASNFMIPDFDKLISIIRSRGISTTVILQSVTQLEGLYGPSRACTILMNCDTLRYLGGCDLSTCNYIAQRLGKPIEQILSLPLDMGYRLVRGERPVLQEKRLLFGEPSCEMSSDTLATNKNNEGRALT